MNTTTPDQRPTTLQVTGAELLQICADARNGLLTIMALSVTGNGKYLVRVMGKTQRTEEVIT